MKRKVSLLLMVVMLFSVFAGAMPAFAAETEKAEITLKMYAFDPDKNVVDFNTDLTGQPLVVGDVVAIVPVLTNLQKMAQYGVYHFSYAFHYDTKEMKQLLLPADEMIESAAAQNAVIKQGFDEQSPLNTAYDVQVSTFQEPNANIAASETEMLFQMVFIYNKEGETVEVLKDTTGQGVKLGAYPFEVTGQSADGALSIGVKEDAQYLSGSKLQTEGSLQNVQSFDPGSVTANVSRPTVQLRSRQPVVTAEKNLDVDGNFGENAKATIKTFADGAPVTATTTVAMYEQKAGSAVQTVTAVADTENGGYKIEIPLTQGTADRTYYFAAQEASNYAWSSKVVLPADNITKPNVEAILGVDAAKAVAEVDLSTDMTAVEKAAIHGSGLPAAIEALAGTTKAELFSKYALNEKVTVQLTGNSVYYDPGSKFTTVPVVWDLADNFVLQDDGSHQFTLTGKFDATSLKNQGIALDGVVTTETVSGAEQPTDIRPTVTLTILNQSRMPAIAEDHRFLAAQTGNVYMGDSRVVIKEFVDGSLITRDTKIFLYNSLDATEPTGDVNGYAAVAQGPIYYVEVPLDGLTDQNWYFAAVEGDSYLESERAVLLKKGTTTTEVQKAMLQSDVEQVTDTVLAGLPEAELQQFRVYGLPEYIYTHEGATGDTLLNEYGLQQRVSIQLKKDSPYYNPEAKYSVVGVDWLVPKNDPAEPDVAIDDTYTVSFGDAEEITLNGSFNQTELTAKGMKTAEDTVNPVIKLRKIEKSDMPKLVATKNLTSENKYGAGANVTVTELVDGTKVGADTVLYVYESAASTTPVASIKAQADGATAYKIVYPFTEGVLDQNWYFSIDMGPGFDESDKAVLLSEENKANAPGIKTVLTDAQAKDTETIPNDALGGMANVEGAVDTFRSSGLVAEVNILAGSTTEEVKEAVQKAVSVELTGPSSFYDPNTSYAALMVDWDLSGYDQTMTAGDKVENVTGTFNAAAMQNAGIAAAIAPAADPQPKITLNIVNSLTGETTVTLVDGNTTEAIEGNSYEKTDIVVYYMKKFKDTGFSAVDASGNDVTDQISRSITVKVWNSQPTFPVKVEDYKEVTYTKAAGTAIDIVWDEFASRIVTGTYTMEYKLGDTVLATRNICVRHLRGDTTFDGQVDLTDLSLLVTNTMKPDTITDEKFFLGFVKYVAEIYIDGQVDLTDLSSLTGYVMKNQQPEQDYEELVTSNES